MYRSICGGRGENFRLRCVFSQCPDGRRRFFCLEKLVLFTDAFFAYESDLLLICEPKWCCRKCFFFSVRNTFWFKNVFFALKLKLLLFCFGGRGGEGAGEILR